ncbi:MAG: hypothetical protein M3O46_20295 [Myxococcota bacterium]|nr:hypothetical protein [Myxococcota bacterium]
MAEPREQSFPPSDPRPAVARGGVSSRRAKDLSFRAQLASALGLGLVLVAGGLYLWRRPSPPADRAGTDEASAPVSAPFDDAGMPIAVADAGSTSPVKLSDTRVLACQDRGPGKTPADQCDHVAPIEKALTSAVEHSAACVPDSLSGGTIEYVADVSFLRRKVSVILPRAGRSVRDLKVVTACATAVRTAMYAVVLDGVDHRHARYKISVTATYPRPSRGS